MYGTTQILVGDVRDQLRTLPDGCVQCVCTSPPYWGLRDYGVDGQIGLEESPDAFVSTMVDVFREVRRVLRDDGVMFLNLGDSYFGGGRGGNPEESVHRKQATNAGSLVQPPYWAKMQCGLKPKDLCMIPWRVFLALQADEWYVRSIIVWAKKSPMPESVTDRPTSSWEPIALMSKSPAYFYDAEAVKEQAGEFRAGGANNGLDHPKVPDPRKKQDALGKQTYTGFNARYAESPVSTRNQRNVWHLGPEPFAEAHFATYPTEIPRRAILAGTSEKGCCPACGAPWRRIVELCGGRTKGRTKERLAAAAAIGKPGGANYASGLDMSDIAKRRTLGWEPGCECGRADVVPCTVLDPFLGSGTTAMVANQLGRNAIGCELNPEYAAMAERRIAAGLRPHTARKDTGDESGLFAAREAT